MNPGGGLQKRNVSKETKINSRSERNNGSENPTQRDKSPGNGESKLTLMDEVLLLVMDPKGFVSIWNDQVSRALRGSILIELWMRGKIELEPAGMKRKSFSRRKVIVKNTTATENCILNEALKIIKDSPAHNVHDWVSYLSGDTWNPLKIKYHMRFVRERLFKDLVERGILSTVKTDYWLMEVKRHPIKNFRVVKQLQTKVKDALLEHFFNDLQRADKRTLSLLMLLQYSGSIEQCLTDLPKDLSHLALRRIEDLEATDFEAESLRGNETDIQWAVYAALKDPYVVI